MFHYVDGYRLLDSLDEISSSSLEEGKDFLRKIYNKLLSLNFKRLHEGNTIMEFYFNTGITRK